MDDEKHYPPGAEPENSAKEEPSQDTPPEPQEPAPEPEKEPKQEPEAPQEPAQEPENKEDPKPEPEPVKKRSIYDQYKDKKQEAKDAKAEADALKSRVAELEGLLAKRKDAPTAEAKADVDDEIKTFADEQKLDPEGLAKLTNLILKKVPKVEIPEGLSKEEIDDWRQSRADQKRQEEDAAVLASAPSVKQQLEIENEEELSNVMKEIVKLSHTEQFHDKEVEYIVWKKRDELSKLVSPKRPSFEAGGTGPEGTEANTDFSDGSKVTPEMVSNHQAYPRSTYEIRSSR